MPLVNPYNFIPLKNEPDRTSWEDVSKHHRLAEDSYSGRLDIAMTAVTPVFVPSRLSQDVEKSPFEYKTKNGPRQDYRTTFKRFSHKGDTPFIQSTSVKGMFRAVFEAVSNSCMALFAEKYEVKVNSKLYPRPEYKVDACNMKDGLCPACAVFGLVHGKETHSKAKDASSEAGKGSVGNKREDEETHLKGKVSFSDAIGQPGSLEKGQWILKELSSPKPERHVPFYAKDGQRQSSGPKGRKFYYHHGNADVQRPGHIDQKLHNQRNVKILERLKAGSRLTTSAEFSGLTQRELSFLLYAIELDLNMRTVDGQPRVSLSMGHKIGMGKPLGLGSVYVMITGGTIDRGAQRYRAFDRTDEIDVREQINAVREAHPVKFPPGMIDLFALTRNAGEKICYPDYNWFRNRQNSQMPLTRNGVFGE